MENPLSPAPEEPDGDRWAPGSLEVAPQAPRRTEISFPRTDRREASALPRPPVGRVPPVVRLWLRGSVREPPARPARPPPPGTENGNPKASARCGETPACVAPRAPPESRAEAAASPGPHGPPRLQARGPERRDPGKRQQRLGLGACPGGRGRDAGLGRPAGPSSWGASARSCGAPAPGVRHRLHPAPRLSGWAQRLLGGRQSPDFSDLPPPLPSPHPTAAGEDPTGMYKELRSRKDKPASELPQTRASTVPVRIRTAKGKHNPVPTAERALALCKRGIVGFTPATEKDFQGGGENGGAWLALAKHRCLNLQSQYTKEETPPPPHCWRKRIPDSPALSPNVHVWRILWTAHRFCSSSEWPGGRRELQLPDTAATTAGLELWGTEVCQNQWGL
ncbi:translation initiation factor IF-2-like isoform X2 [Vulpes lagopus]|uniref:translation initiation factor IF-2-like isoform X2 n=1 Tax=Vulpes lagopus TaxID=494514 RepID=UPI001BC8F4D0|nr:translation initiation factor IF-2-like isoform X2 [Vulpes lagopus]